MDLFMFGAKKLLSNCKLQKLDKIINWQELTPLLKNLHKRDQTKGGGQTPYNPLNMFKAILLGQWHNLSDKDLEECLKIRLDFMLFCDFSTGHRFPDETTLCRFRNILIKKEVLNKLLHSVNQQLEKANLKVEPSCGAIIDATIIESSNRPRRCLEIIAEDRKEPEKADYTFLESADPDARWLKKGKRCYFGYKGFMLTDTENGYINEVHVTPANKPETKELEAMVKKLPQIKKLYADKGYASSDNREFLEKKKISDFIMKKKVQGRDFHSEDSKQNKEISKIRYLVEQGFGTLKRRFSFNRARYKTRLKVEAQFYLKAICFNLLKAVNMASWA